MVADRTDITHRGSILTLLISLSIAVLLPAVSCGTDEITGGEEEKIQLASPSPRTGAIGSTWAELRWEKIEGAMAYCVYFDDDPHPLMSIKPGITMEGLAQATTYTVRVTAEPPSRSRYASSAPSGPVTFTTDSKPSVGTPVISVYDLTTLGFTVSWSSAEKVGSYEYVFDAGEPVSTADTILTVGGMTADIPAVLTPGATYCFKVRSLPAEEYSRDFNASPWAEADITLPVPDTLTSPALTVERESSIRSIISWDAIEGAAAYEWILDNSTDTVSTTGLSVKFEGLEKDSVHSLKVRAISADTQKVLDSRWAEVTFTAIYDFSSTLRIGDIATTDREVSFNAAVSQSGEYYTAGVLLKALFMKDDRSAIDTAAVLSHISEGIAGKVGELTEAGRTGPEAYAEVLEEGNVHISLDGLYQSTTYICYALGIELDGSFTSALLMEEAKTADVAPGPAEGVSFTSGSQFMEALPVLQYSYSDGNGARTPYNSCSFTMKRTDGSKTLAAVKYTRMSLSSYDSIIGIRGAESAGALSAYIEKNGSSLSATSLNSLNSGKSVATTFINLAEDTEYVSVIRAITSDADTLVAAAGFRTLRQSASWASVSGTDDGEFTVSSALPPVSGISCTTTLASSNNTPSLIPDWLTSKGSAISAARIEALAAGNTYTASYSLTAGSTYIFGVRLTNAAGDEAIACAVVKKPKS